MAKLVFGLGTGRCGTRSLTKLLNEQPDITAVHEGNFPLWKPNNDRALAWLKKLLKESLTPITGDIAYYWLSYIGPILEIYPDTKFICLERPKKEVIASYTKSKMLPMDFDVVASMFGTAEPTITLSEYVKPEELNAMDPSTREWVETYWDVPMNYMMDCAILNRKHGPQNRQKYLNQYCDDYYRKSHLLQKKYPDSFIIADMHETLNTEAGKSKIFNFIGIAPNAAVQ